MIEHTIRLDRGNHLGVPGLTWVIRKEVDPSGDFGLMDQELNLVDLHCACELDDHILGVDTKPLAHPPFESHGVLSWIGQFTDHVFSILTGT